MAVIGIAVRGSKMVPACVDVSIAKLMTFRWPGVGSSLEFRAEFYNTLNPPQFANPEPNYSSALSRARL
jgi:hypothetical protein